MRKKRNLIGRLPDGKEIRLASQEEIEQCPYELEDILGIIGHPEAMITRCVFDWRFLFRQ